jgi:hypothetical protein
MSNYTETTNFTALTTAHAVINGAAFDLEYGNIATAIASKLDNGVSGYPGPFIMNVGTSSSSVTLTVNGTSAAEAMLVQGNPAGLYVYAGSASTNLAFTVNNQANTTTFLSVFGDGGVAVGNGLSSKGPGTVNVATGYYINGVASSGSGTFTATLSGMTGTTTGTVSYERAGKLVTLSIPVGNIEGTSNSGAMIMSGLPAIVTPATGSPICLCFAVNSGTTVLAYAQVVPAGTIGFVPLLTNTGSNPVLISGTGTFANTGTKGLVASWNITYSVD